MPGQATTAPDLRDWLAQQAGVDAVVTYGSAARGDPEAGDLDVLVVAQDPSVRHALIHDRSLDANPHLSVSFYGWDDLDRRLRQVPSFAAHLRDEGRIQGSTEARHRFSALLQSIPLDEAGILRELHELNVRAARLADESRLANSYDTAMGRLYAIGRAAAILQLMLLGEHEYSWRSTFRRLGALRPDLQGPLDRVTALRPYFDALAGRYAPSSVERPNPSEDYQALVRAVRTLTAS